MLDYVDQMFNRFGATQEVVDANFDNLTTQTNIFTSNLKTAIAESATPAMETLAGTMQRLNAEMDAGKYQPFIVLMANGMELIGSGIAWVAENLNWLAPAVLGGATAFIVYKGVQMTATAAMAIFKAVTALTTGNVLQLTAAVAGLVGGMAAMSAVSKQIDAGVEMDMESAKKQFADPFCQSSRRWSEAAGRGCKLCTPQSKGRGGNRRRIHALSAGHPGAEMACKILDSDPCPTDDF